MAAFLFPELQFNDNVTGDPLASGKIYTYTAGTDTPLATYTDNTGGVSAGVYVDLDSNGRPNNGNGIWLGGTSTYKFVIKDADGTTVQTVDNIVGSGNSSSTSTYITTAADATLVGSRQLAAGNGLSLTDGGAGSTITINTNAIVNSQTGTTYTALATDNTKTIIFSGQSTATLSLTAAATLATGWSCWVINNNTGTLTIDPNSSEQINSATTLLVARGDRVRIVCNGSAFFAMSSQLETRFNSQTGTTYTADATDKGKTIYFGSQSTATLSLTAAATLGAGWYCEVMNVNSGILTIDPNGAETINAGSTLTLGAFSSCRIVCDGSAFVASLDFWPFSNTVYLNNKSLSMDTGSITLTTGGSVTAGTGNIIASVGYTSSYKPPVLGANTSNLTANTNDLAITSAITLLTTTGAWDLTGVVPVTAASGQVIVLSNTSANTVTIKHESASSTAANRFKNSTGADLSLTTNKTQMFFYDTTASRWRNICVA